MTFIYKWFQKFTFIVCNIEDVILFNVFKYLLMIHDIKILFDILTLIIPYVKCISMHVHISIVNKMFTMLILFLYLLYKLLLLIKEFSIEILILKDYSVHFSNSFILQWTSL